MKRVISMMLVLAMMFSLTACSGTTKKTGSDSAGGQKQFM